MDPLDRRPLPARETLSAAADRKNLAAGTGPHRSRKAGSLLLWMQLVTNKGSIISIDGPLRSPCPRRATEPAHQEVGRGPLAAHDGARHRRGGDGAEFIEAPDDDSDGDGPRHALARAPTSLHLGVDADDAVWREAARTGSPLYDVEIRAVGAAWRAVATGSAERRHRVEGLRPNVAYCARARRDNGTWGPPSRVLRCSGGAPSWFEAWRHKRRRRKESKLEVLCFACVANRLDADVQDLLRLIHEYLAPRRLRAHTPIPARAHHVASQVQAARLDGRGGEDVGGGARSH